MKHIPSISPDVDPEADSTPDPEADSIPDPDSDPSPESDSTTDPFPIKNDIQCSLLNIIFLCTRTVDSYHDIVKQQTFLDLVFH